MEFDIIDYIKKEWKIVLIIIILINIISSFMVFNVKKTEYQTKITIKLPQYININSDIQTIIYLGVNYVENEPGIKDYDVKFKGETEPGTTIVNFTVVGTNKDQIFAFSKEIKPKLLEQINELIQERFTYEWQLKNAQSGIITDYSTIREKVHLASAIDLTGSQPVIQKVQEGNIKKMLTIFLGSIILSGCISILHYLFTIKSNKHNNL